MTPSELLITAKARLTLGTWRQYPLTIGMVGIHHGFGNYDCLVTALAHSAETRCHPVVYQALDELVACLPKDKWWHGTLALDPVRFWQLDPAPLLALWNDSPGRTLSEVHQLYDQAIARAQRKEQLPRVEERELVGV